MLNVIVTAALCTAFGFSGGELSTIAVYVTSLICLMIIVRLSIPFNLLRSAMLVVSVAGLLLSFIFFGWFFMFVPLGMNAIIMLCVSSAATIVMFNVLYNIADKLIEKDKNKPYKNN